MKKHLKPFLIAICGIAITFASCKKSEDVRAEDHKQVESLSTSFRISSCAEEPLSDGEIIDYLRPMGEAHNNGLTRFYNQLLANPNVTENDIRDFTMSYSQNTVPLFECANGSYTLAALDTFYKEDLNGQIVKFGEPSQSLKDAFAEIKTHFFEAERFEVPSFNEGLDAIMARNLPLISDYYERVTLIAAVTVGKASVEYWDVHIDEWNSLYGRDYTVAKLSPRQEQVMHTAYEDLVGAGVGAWQARKWAMALGGGGPASLAVVAVVGIYEGVSASAGGYLAEKAWGWVKSWFD